MLRKIFILICLLILPSVVDAQERYLRAYAGLAGFQSRLELVHGGPCRKEAAIVVSGRQKSAPRCACFKIDRGAAPSRVRLLSGAAS